MQLIAWKKEKTRSGMGRVFLLFRLKTFHVSDPSDR